MKRLVPYKIRQAVKRRLNRIAANYLRLSAINESVPDDVFIVGYPKSGNTWLQNILVELVYGIDTTKINDSLLQELVPDVHFKRYFKRFGKRMFFKSHFLPKPEYRKVIYILRDGRDVMVSYHHYLKATGQVTGDISSTIQTHKALFPSKWHVHVETWLNNPYDSDMLVIKYEELLENPVKTLHLVTDFLELDVLVGQIEEVIERTSFGKMQDKEKSTGWDNSRDWPEDKLFVRRGTSGSYKDEMPAITLDCFLAESSRTLKRCGYDV